MKDLKDYLNESINETATIPLPGAYGDQDLIEFAANFDNFNSKNEEDWEDWENHYIDSDWAMKNKPLLKKFCDLCSKIVKSKIEMRQCELGNFNRFSEDDDPEWIMDEMGVQPGDYVLHHCTDGDNGEFFIMSCDGKDKASRKLIDEFVKMTHDPAGWDVEVEEAPEE